MKVLDAKKIFNSNVHLEIGFMRNLTVSFTQKVWLDMIFTLFFLLYSLLGKFLLFPKWLKFAGIG